MTARELDVALVYGDSPQAILVAHQRMAHGGCACEGLERRRSDLLGRSHSQHVLDELRAAGFAIVRDFTVAATVEPQPGPRCPSSLIGPTTTWPCWGWPGHQGMHTDSTGTKSWSTT